MPPTLALPSDRVIIGIVVTYNPSPERFRAVLEAVRPQVSHLIIVDNGSSDAFLSDLKAAQADDLTLIALPDNKGIAAAQNEGLCRARERGANYALLLDHDSIPENDMVAHLFAAAEKIQASGQHLAAVGPVFTDTRLDNDAPFIRTERLHLVRFGCAKETIVPTDYLIASGSLIPMATLAAVGEMDERLFIDYVDIEWGLRAKRLGYRTFGIGSARMSHALGDAVVPFWGRRIPLHSPLRHYYLFRNRVWLYQQKTMPLNWKLVDAYRLARSFLFYAWFAKPRLAHVHFMLLGLYHGLCGKLGKLTPGA